MQTTEILKKLISFTAISGFENTGLTEFSELLEAYCSDVTINKSGCIIGKIPSEKSCGKSILIEAHFDQIGLIVTEICDNGFLRFAAVGGVDERILPASEVYILGKEKVFGVIGAKPPHLSGKDTSKASTIQDMLIDTSMDSDILRKIISVGDPIILRSDFSELKNNCVASSALDNRAGMASVFHCLKQIKGMDIPYDIYICFSTGEETGLHGAYTIPWSVKPDLAIVVDVTHGATPDSPAIGTFPLGCGAVICRGPNLHYDLTKSIINLSKQKSIPYEIEVAAGSSGTNAWALQNLGGGIPCVLISIPLRYMHTSVEVVDISDIESVGTLLTEIVLGGVPLA